MSLAGEGRERGTLRPPSEKNSLLLRVVRNCSWNRCAFCPAFKNEAFSLRPLEDILREIDLLAEEPDSPRFTTAFLQDADALVAPVGHLLAVLERLHERMPTIRRVTAYSRGRTLAARKPHDLETLRRSGLDRLHVGVESANDEVLSLMQKGVSAATQEKGCLHAMQAGFQLCCYVMPGLGGRRLSADHARDTSAFLRRIGPHHVRLRTCRILAGTPLADLWQNGRFEPLAEEETVREIRDLIEGISGIRTELVSDHRINLLLELHGRLPEDADRLLGIIDRFFALPPEERILFIVGRLSGRLRFLNDLSVPDIHTELLEVARDFVFPLPIPVGMLY
jgi:radical SAM superfamily enzyme YgiQ (UPF0313 family)